MIIHCPSCQTQFFMSAPALGEGRQVRCSKCQHEWHQTPDMTAEEDIPLSVMPRAQEIDEDSEGGFDPKAYVLRMRTDKPMVFAAVIASIPFVILALVFVLLSFGRGVTYPTLPEGVSAENWRIEVGNDGSVNLYALLVNETNDPQPMPLITLHDSKGTHLVVKQESLQVSKIPALSEVEMILPVEGYSDEVQGVAIYLNGFADVTEFQPQDMSADKDHSPEPQQGQIHPQDEHHTPKQAQ